MISFNDLLRSSGLDPATVRLVRHQDRRAKTSHQLFHYWENDRPKFELCQRIQSSLRFGDAKWVASFVATPTRETLFVGMYRIRGVDDAPIGLIDPISQKNVEGHRFYDLSPESILAEYSGKLTVDWGRGYKAWVQRADKQNKRIIDPQRNENSTSLQSKVPVYADFGEAPNDDPNELRMFAGKVRRGQPQFRDKLIHLYRSKCAITGTEVQDVLEACHILLHSKSGINHSDNGILLRSDVHILFDQGLIGIDPQTMTIVVDPRLKESVYEKYQGQPLPIRSDGSQMSKKYLKQRLLLGQRTD
jgi:HNH endonuclease